MMDRKILVEERIRIKAYEIDAMGVVSNIHYVKWFEDLRHRMLDVHYPYDEMMKVGISPVLMKTEVEYKHPLTIQDHPVGMIWATKMDKMKWELRFEIMSDGRLCCKGVQKGCFWDLNRGRPTLVPERLRQAFVEQSK